MSSSYSSLDCAHWPGVVQFVQNAIYGVTLIFQDGGYTASQIYTVSQKKTSPTFLAITRESIVGFLSYLAHMLPRK